MRRVFPWVFLALVSCDSATTTTQDDLSMLAGADLSKSTADLAKPSGDLAVMVGSIPDPGVTHTVDSNFADVEPNDSPSQATPLGVSQQAMVYLWITNNTAGGTDTADYYVFKTGNMAGSFTLGFSGLCWSGGITAMDATLWKVVAGAQVLPPVQTWMSTTSCTPPGTAPALEANTTYLLGIFITGAAGTYFA